jgi:hypothetical protein
MSVVERGIGTPVARVGERETDIIAEEIDALDLPLPPRLRATVKRPLRVEMSSLSLIGLAS